jgi:hypothetical protein
MSFFILDRPQERLVADQPSKEGARLAARAELDKAATKRLAARSSEGAIIAV